MQPQAPNQVPNNTQPPQAPGVPPVPYQSNGSKYATLYLVVLILTSIYASITLIGAPFSLISTLGMFSTSPLIGGVSLLNLLFSLLVVPAVILLFLEKKWGVWLIFTQTGLSLLGGIALTVIASLNTTAFHALSIGWCVLTYFAWKGQQNHRALKGHTAHQ